AERHALDRALGREGDSLQAAGDVPELHPAVQARRGEVTLVGREDDAGYAAHVACQGELPRGRGFLQRRGVPDPDGQVVTQREEAPAVRAKDQPMKETAVSAQGQSLLTRWHVPEPHRLVPASGGGEAPAVGTER